MSRNRTEEITYYDELGVARNASPEQVRDAFRALVRLLHPDQHTDQSLKAVAEMQMRKLNRIYDVLSDESKRREYDDYLEEDHGPATPLMSDKLRSVFGSEPGKANKAIGRLAWLGATGVAGVLLGLLASDGGVAPSVVAGTEKPSSARQEAGASAPDESKELGKLRADLKLARFERDAAMQELARMRGGVRPAPVSTSAETDRKPELPAVSLPMAALTEIPVNPGMVTGLPPVSLPAKSTAPKPGMRALTGFWFYMKSQEEKGKSAGLYPPEFIEASITEQNGQVKGRYRSRYRIVDRAISPDVNFEFNGTVSGGIVTASWTGPGGARGEITMKMLSDNSMKIDWTADQLGTIQGLTQGTASLTRRLD